MYRLAICADTVFLDLPFKERLKKIAEAGFLVGRIYSSKS